MKVWTLDHTEMQILANALVEALRVGQQRFRVGEDKGTFKFDDGTGWSIEIGTDTTGRS